MSILKYNDRAWEDSKHKPEEFIPGLLVKLIKRYVGEDHSSMFGRVPVYQTVNDGWGTCMTVAENTMGMVLTFSAALGDTPELFVDVLIAEKVYHVNIRFLELL